ncbi:MAG: hypothetical protein ISS45_07985 [Candidatus Omnitrophica bacterium]|nr:hypothetical protein [Candidatus Omnitrophota bacterium]
MMNRRQILLFVLILFFNTAVYASLPDVSLYANRREAVSDEQLGKIAVENGIIPADADQDYFKEQVEEQNTTLVWILANRESKVRMIEGIKREFSKQEGVTIARPALYYVDEINGCLYGAIEDGTINDERKKGWLGKLFKMAAMTNGDFDDGKANRIGVLRAWAGEEIVERLKKEQPDRYEHLMELDKRDKNRPASSF